MTSTCQPYQSQSKDSPDKQDLSGLSVWGFSRTSVHSPLSLPILTIPPLGSTCSLSKHLCVGYKLKVTWLSQPSVAFFTPQTQIALSSEYKAVLVVYLLFGTSSCSGASEVKPSFSLICLTCIAKSRRGLVAWSNLHISFVTSRPPTCRKIKKNYTLRRAPFVKSRMKLLVA